MASRALGAMLAIVAAILLMASLLSPKVTTLVPAWWDGPPTINGKERTQQSVHVGPFGAAGCNNRGCEGISTSSDAELIGYGVGGLIGVTTILAVLLAMAVWNGGTGRKLLAAIELLLVILVAAGAAYRVYLGDEVKADVEVEVPLGIGFYVFGGALGCLVLASISTFMTKEQPLRLKTPSRKSKTPVPAPPPDVRQIVRDTNPPLRPSGPVDPPTGAAAPLFDAAPQLRPLFEAEGKAPALVQPVLPTALPTPIPRAAISAYAGIPTPAASYEPPPELKQPIETKKPPTMPPPLGMPTPMPDSVLVPPRPRTPSVPPRPKSPSVPPSNPPANARTKAASIPPPSNPPANARTKAASIPPPSPPVKPSTNPPGKSPTTPPPPKPSTNPPRAKGASVAPVPPPAPSDAPVGRKTPPAGDAPIGRKTPGEQPIEAKRPPNPTTVAAVVPPPERPSQARLDSEAEDTGISPPPEKEPITSVEVDASAKAAKRAEMQRIHGQRERVAAAEEARRRDADLARIAEAKRREADERAAETEALAKRRANRLLTGDGPDTATDGSELASAIGERREELELSTEEQRALAADEASAPVDKIVGEHTDQIGPTSAQFAAIAESPGDELKLGMRRAPTATPIDPSPQVKRPITDGPPVEPPPPTAPLPPIVPGAPGMRVPLTTAPQTLPPPKKAEVPTSGPTPACPQCESPMAWVEEHLRFYCKSCRMYF